MPLPGGLWRGGERHRGFAFQPLTGAVELAMAAASSSSACLPARVTAVLAAALEQVGGEPADTARVHGLCVGDRQFLARQLAAHLGRDGVWLVAECGRCGESFDFYVEQSSLPVKEAGKGAPWAEAETSRGTCRLRLPTGADQEAIAAVEDDREALRELAARCLVAVDGARVDEESAWRRRLPDEDLAAIEAALEGVAPEVALRARVRCPQCAHDHDVWVDPYLGLEGLGEELLAEIHELASTYHWSEAELLSLPQERRRLYLRMVDRSRGRVQ